MLEIIVDGGQVTMDSSRCPSPQVVGRWMKVAGLLLLAGRKEGQLALVSGRYGAW